ncbi:MAG: efflux RND transporter permease subunit [Planctomycetota bacterium]
MDPVRFAVTRPYTVAVAVILALIFSVLAAQRIPIQLKPTVDNPIIEVSTVYRGAGPVEVEERITREIEDLLQSVDGLDKLTSTSVEGRSEVVLEYGWGVDKDRAVIDVINKLSELRDLPADAEKPVVTLTNQRGGNAVMWIAVIGPYDTNRVRQIVKDQVEPLLERVPGVGSLMVVGGEEREVRVLLDPERLASRGVSTSELVSALQRGAVDLRGGTVETATRQYVVRTEGRSTDPEDLEQIVVRRDAGGTVRVGDVARVVDGYRETTSIVHNETGPIVAIGVRSEPGANVVELIEGVDAELAALNARFRDAGLELTLKPVHRDTTYLNQALDFVVNSLWQGALLAVIVLLVFLRSVRSVLIVALSIPISLITVFLVMDAFGRTLNVVSLAGLAFAAGMVVDNAIVVLENTFRHLEMEKSARDAARDGGREVWGGVLAATLTTIAVFVPILGIEEEAGQLFADLALAISAAVGLSLVVSLTVIPCLASVLYAGRRLRRGAGRRAPDAGGAPTLAALATARAAAPASSDTPTDAQSGAQSGAPAGAGAVPIGGAFGLGRLGGLYARATRDLTRPGGTPRVRRLALVAVVLAVSVATVFIVPPAGYLPSGNANLIFYFGDPIPGMRPEAMVASMAPLEDWMRAQPELLRYFMVIGLRFNGGGVVLKDEYADGPGLDEFQQRMLPRCLAVPGFRSLIPIRNTLFRDGGKQFTLEITGSDFGRLSKAADRLQQELNAWPSVQRVTSDYIEGRPELKVRADPHLAAEAGLSVSDVGRIVETALAGRIVATYSDGSRDYDVNLVVPQERIRNEQDLATLPLITPTGARTTLGAIAKVERGTGPQSVHRLERQRAITLTVNLRPDAVLQSALEETQARAIDPVVATMAPDDRIEMGGSADKFTSTLKSLTGSFWLAILITYLLLVALFRSWASPFVILVSVPLALTGGLVGITLAHHLSPDASFDLLSMLGFVILAGIVVNNAILIIHQCNNLRALGLERRAALAEAALNRLRPILMSVTTTVCGMLPLAIGRGAGAELYQGLAAVVVGGLVMSTLFTLFLVPALLTLGWDIEEALRGRTTALAGRREAAPQT